MQNTHASVHLIGDGEQLDIHSHSLQLQGALPFLGSYQSGLVHLIIQLTVLFDVPHILQPGEMHQEGHQPHQLLIVLILIEAADDQQILHIK